MYFETDSGIANIIVDIMVISVMWFNFIFFPCAPDAIPYDSASRLRQSINIAKDNMLYFMKMLEFCFCFVGKYDKIYYNCI